MLTDLIEAVREQCVFTTHTPVPAGHDQFPEELAQRVLGDHRRSTLMKACGMEQRLNLTQLALRGARYVNGVAMKHGEVSQGMFPGYPIHSITNGVHAVTWTASSVQKLCTIPHLPDWRQRSTLACAMRWAFPPRTSGRRMWKRNAR